MSDFDFFRPTNKEQTKKEFYRLKFAFFRSQNDKRIRMSQRLVPNVSTPLFHSLLTTQKNDYTSANQPETSLYDVKMTRVNLV